MRLSHKFGKILSGEALRSARRHVRAFFRNRRLPSTASAEAVIASINAPGLETIRRKYAVDNPGDDWPKYLELDRWMRINLQRARHLELDSSRPLRILDIGSGAGYFLYISKLLGHDVLGLDVTDIPMFAEMTALLGIPRVIARVEAFEKLPDFNRKFDLVTAHLICFNNHKTESVWGPAEWDFFLDDIASRLAPNGRVWLELNREASGAPYSPELKAFFEERGALVDSYRVFFNRGSLEPRGAAPVAL